MYEIPRDRRIGPVTFNDQPYANRADYENVDVAIIMESTYPYLTGGVSAVVHDIVTSNPEVTFGIVHITWDKQSPHRDLYGVPSNVKWVAPIYLAMTEHKSNFMGSAAKVKGSSRFKTALCHRVFDALAAISDGDVEAAWRLYDEGLNPRTRTYPLWGLLGTREWMLTSRERWPSLDLPLVESFWLMREFFSLIYAVMVVDFPYAKVYHAHTTGYAALLGAAAARQNGTKFLLTEHNLYVRDTVNTMLDRHMALPVTRDWKALEATPTHRAWMAWWIDMALFSYPSAETITFLYPKVFSEAEDIGAPIEKGVVLANGVRLSDFQGAYEARQVAVRAIVAEAEEGRDHVWKLTHIGRVVPIKGHADLIESVRLLVDRGITNFHIDLLGPTEHVPWYFDECVAKIRDYGLDDFFTFRGTVNVRDVLPEYDMLVLPSHNEGQPIVVLEAMVAGLPTLGTTVGGMEQLVVDVLETGHGAKWEACGSLVAAGDVVGMADQMQTVMRDPDTYLSWSQNARGRVVEFFQLEDAMRKYNELYRGMSESVREPAPQPVDLMVNLARFAISEREGRA